MKKSFMENFIFCAVTYSELCQIRLGFLPKQVMAFRSIIDIWQGFEFISDTVTFSNQSSFQIYFSWKS